MNMRTERRGDEGRPDARRKSLRTGMRMGRAACGWGDGRAEGRAVILKPARRATRAAGLLGAAAFLLLAGVGCARHAEEKRATAAPVPVRTVTLVEELEPGSVEAIGTLRAAREATIAGKVMGTVTEIRKRAGDSVREGEILLVIDSRDVAGQVVQAEGALAQARAAATLAETNYRRFEQLHQRGAASGLELDQARYQHETALGAVKQAEGAVATASSYSAYARIPAPFNGRVVDRLAEEGDLAAPGRPLMKIEDATRLRLFASLEASRADAAEVGKRVTVRVPELGGRPVPGTITEVSPSADPGTRSILVKIDLEPDPALRSGLFGRVRIPVGERSALRLPADAVVRRGGLTGAFVVKDGRAVYRMVTLDDDGSDRLEVLAGLRSGETVVLAPPEGLEIGAAVEVRR